MGGLSPFGGLNAIGMGGAGGGDSSGGGGDPFGGGGGFGDPFGGLSGGADGMDPGAFDGSGDMFGGFPDTGGGVDPTGSYGATQAFQGGAQNASQNVPGSLTSPSGDQPGAGSAFTGSQQPNPQNPQHPDQPNIPDIVKAFEHGPDSISGTPGAGSLTGSRYDAGPYEGQPAGATRGVTPYDPFTPASAPQGDPSANFAQRFSGGAAPSNFANRYPGPSEFAPAAQTPQPQPPVVAQAPGNITGLPAQLPPTTAATPATTGGGIDQSGTAQTGAPASSAAGPATQMGGGGRMPQSPLEQFFTQLMHTLLGGGRGLPISPMEQMLAHALGIRIPEQFPQFRGNPFNRPVTPGYYPPGAVGGVPPRGPQVPPRGPTSGPERGAEVAPEAMQQAMPQTARHSPGSPGGTVIGGHMIPGVADASGVPSGYTRGLIDIESSGKVSEITKGNYGLGQFSPDQWQHFGITAQNWRDPAVQIRAINQEARENIPRMTSALGRAPTAAELYLAHQQNVPEAIALIKNPNAPAWQAVRPFYHSEYAALTAISNNNPSGLPAAQMTAGQFVNMWNARFNRSLQ